MRYQSLLRARLISVLLVAVFAGAIGLATHRCRNGRGKSPPGNEPAGALAGRYLQIETAEYALYAQDAGRANKLRKWLDGALEEFESTYGVNCLGRGIVLAIGPGKEPDGAVDRWRDDHVPKRRKSYCASRGEPFFRESFAIPVDAADELGLLAGAGARAPWVCVLTTDEHLVGALEDLRRRNEEEDRRIEEESRRKGVVTPKVNYDSFGGALLKMAIKHAHRQHLRIDTKIMHLQRRQTLWNALIECCFDDPTRIRDLKADLLILA